MKNHMIEYLRNNGVQIYERPQISSAACRNEWSEFGACCSLSSLRGFLQKKFLTNQLTLGNQIQEIQKAAQRLAEFRDKYLVIQSGSGGHWALGSENEVSAPVTANLLPLDVEASESSIPQGSSVTDSSPVSSNSAILSIRAQLDQIQMKLLTAQPQRIQLQEKCVSKLNEVVSTTACPICSGRAEDFFEDGSQLLKISPALLNIVLVECHPAWTSLVEFQRDTQNYTDLVLSNSNYTCSSGNGKQCLEAQSITMSVSNFIKKRNLISGLLKCDAKSLATCEFKHVAALCEQFIHIQDPGYSSKFEDEVKNMTTAVDSLQMAFNDKQVAYQQINATFQKRSWSFTEKHGLTLVRAGFFNYSKAAAEFRSLWDKTQLARAELLYILGSRPDFANLFSQTETRLVQLQTHLEDFLAQHEVSKWVKLRSLISEIALSKMRSGFAMELAKVWQIETSIIQRWSQKAPTPAESEVLAVLNATAIQAFSTLQWCFKLPAGMIGKWLWEKVMTKVQLVITGTSNPSDIHSLIKELFPHTPVGQFQLSGECRIDDQTMTKDSGDQIETGGKSKNPQCNPCVDPDPNDGSGLWGPGP